MRALYCHSKASFLDLLAPLFAKMDSLYWIVDCQRGPVQAEWIHAHEAAFEAMQVTVPAFADTTTKLWRPGTLKQVRKALAFEPFTYFVGFQASEAEAVGRATRLERARYFSPEFYDLLQGEGWLLAVQVDGWWEFYPAKDGLFSRLKESVDGREMVPRNPGEIDWTPQFM